MSGHAPVIPRWRILQWPAPPLRQRAHELADDALHSSDDRPSRARRLGNLLDATCTAHDGVGLAATQLGILQRVALIHPPHANPWLLVNPEVLEVAPDDEWEQAGEGCLSLTGIGAPVRRPTWMVITTIDPDTGERHERDVAGYEARIVAHELAHLDGRTIVDDTLPDARAQILTRYRDVVWDSRAIRALAR